MIDPTGAGSPPPPPAPARRRGPSALVAALLIAAIAGGVVAAGATVAYLRIQSRTAASGLQIGGRPSVGVETTLAAVAQRAQPAVVAVLSDTTVRGSGFWVSGDGFVVTAVSAVVGASNLGVLLDARRRDARLVDYDCQAGVAVLKVDQVGGLPTLAFADSSSLRPGQAVVAVTGLPGQAPARAAISAAHRNLVVAGLVDAGARAQLVDVVQAEPSLQGAGSGAPVLNSDGQVVGVGLLASLDGRTTAITLAANGIQPAVEQIVATGGLTVAAIGAETEEVSSDEGAGRALTPGALVSRVSPGGAAEQAGLRRGDTVVQLGDQRLDATHPLAQLLRTQFRPNQRVTVTYSRGGATAQVQLVLGGEHPRCA